MGASVDTKDSLAHPPDVHTPYVHPSMYPPHFTYPLNHSPTPILKHAVRLCRSERGLSRDGVWAVFLEALKEGFSKYLEDEESTDVLQQLKEVAKKLSEMLSAKTSAKGAPDGSSAQAACERVARAGLKWAAEGQGAERAAFLGSALPPFVARMDPQGLDRLCAPHSTPLRPLPAPLLHLCSALPAVDSQRHRALRIAVPMSGRVLRMLGIAGSTDNSPFFFRILRRAAQIDTVSEDRDGEEWEPLRELSAKVAQAGARSLLAR